jgi:hypothetical protein
VVHAADAQSTELIQGVIDTEIAKLTSDTDCWLAHLDYTINYNAFDLLDLTIRVSGVGAYPSTNITHLTLSLRDGKPVTAEAAFLRREDLANLLDRRLQSALARAPIVQPDNDRHTGSHRFQVGDLDSFIVTEKGIVFTYDFLIPHAGRVGTPDSEFLVTVADISGFARLDGPLTWLLPRVR